MYMYIIVIYTLWNIVEKKKKLLIHLELYYVFVHWIPILYKNWKYKYAYAECIYRIITNNHFFISKGDGTGPMRIEINGSSFRTSLTSIPYIYIYIYIYIYRELSDDYTMHMIEQLYTSPLHIAPAIKATYNPS